MDGVKVDCQSTLDMIGSSLGGGSALSGAYHAALEESVARHFPGNACINCMCHSTNDLYRCASARRRCWQAVDQYPLRAPPWICPVCDACSVCWWSTGVCREVPAHAEGAACLSRMTDTAVARSSDDFWPRDPASHTTHVAVNAVNSLFMAALVQPDWDMFHSQHPAALLHASARVVSSPTGAGLPGVLP